MVPYLIHIALVSVLLWWFGRGLHSAKRLSFYAGAGFKIGAGWFFGWLYLHHLGGGDTFSYFHEAIPWNDLFWKNPQAFFQGLFSDLEIIPGRYSREPRAMFMVKTVGIVSLWAGTRYWLISLYFSLLSFVASWYFFSQLSKYKPRYTAGFWCVLFAFPGLMFWGSGILKETIAIAGLFVLSALYLKVLIKRRVRWAEWLAGILALFLLIKLKYYVVAVFLPICGIACYYVLIDRITLLRYRWVRYSLPLTMGLLLLFFVINLSPNFLPANFLNRIVTDHDRLMALTDPDFGIHYYNYEPTVFSFLINAPIAVFSGLFRPLVFEGTGLQFLAGIQNLLVFFALLWAANRQRSHRYKLSATIWCCMIYCLIMATFLAYATPNFGTLERYKSMYQPFLLLMLVPTFYPRDKNRLSNSVQVKKE
ncbi:MAG: hypothetical protein AAFO69_12090 [Bacteroidota bacterium]